MYLQFPPKMNDTLCSENYFPFALENIVNLVIFSMKVIFGKRELLVPVDLSKSSIETFANE